MADDQDSSQSTLGEYLRHERERRGITIEQVASATKISVRLLHLLESDQYVELPAKPFVRGFVNSYCRFIGVDAKEVLIRFGTFLEEHSHERPTRDEGHSGYAFEKREGEQSRTGLTITMAIFIVLGGLAFFILKPSLKHHHGSKADKLREANESPSPEPSSSPSPSDSTSSSPSVSPMASPSASVSFQVIAVPSALPSVIAFTPSPSPTPTPTPTPTPSPSPSKSHKPKPSPSPSLSPIAAAAPSASPSPNTSPSTDALNSGVNLKPAEIKYKVVIKTSGDVWVRYQVDQRPRMKFILREGRVLVLRAQATLRFQSSTPEAITFRVNGGAERPMTDDSNASLRGKDLTLFFPRESAETIQEPFPGERALQGAFMPIGKGNSPAPAPTE